MFTLNHHMSDKILSEEKKILVSKRGCQFYSGLRSHELVRTWTCIAAKGENYRKTVVMFKIQPVFILILRNIK